MRSALLPPCREVNDCRIADDATLEQGQGGTGRKWGSHAHEQRGSRHDENTRRPDISRRGGRQRSSRESFREAGDGRMECAMVATGGCSAPGHYLAIPSIQAARSSVKHSRWSGITPPILPNRGCTRSIWNGVARHRPPGGRPEPEPIPGHGRPVA